MSRVQPELADVALRSEQARYQELFEFAPVGYLVSDSAGMILEANRAAADLLGVAAPKLIVGKPIAVFVPIENRKQFRRTLLGLARNSTAANVGAMWTRTRDAVASRVDSSNVWTASHWPANAPNVTRPAPSSRPAILPRSGVGTHRGHRSTAFCSFSAARSGAGPDCRQPRCLTQSGPLPSPAATVRLRVH